MASSSWSLQRRKTTARQQNVFRFFGPRCLCQNFVTIGGVLVLVLAEEKTTARQQNSFRSPMPLPKFRDLRWRPRPGPGPGACRGENNGAPAKQFSVPDASSQKFALSPVRSLFGPHCFKIIHFFLACEQHSNFCQIKKNDQLAKSLIFCVRTTL